MAFATKYRVLGKDFQNRDVQFDILIDGYSGSVMELEGYSARLIRPVKENKFEPVSGCGLTLTVYSGGYDLSELYTISPFEIQVKYWLNSNIEFSGFLNPEIYDEDYTTDDGLLEITANDGLAAINRVPFHATTANAYAKGRDTFFNIIEECLSDLDFTYYYLTSEIIIEGFTYDYEVLTKVKADLSNYIDEDGKSATKREVLEMVLTRFGLSCYIKNGKCFIFDPTLLATESNIGITILSRAGAKLQEITITNTYDISDEVIEFLHVQQRKVIGSGYNEIIINYSPYPDTKKVISYGELSADNATEESATIDNTTHVVKEYYTTENEGLSVKTSTSDLINCFKVCKYAVGEDVENGKLYIGTLAAQQFNYSAKPANTALMKITAGHVVKTQDTNTLKFKVVFDSSYNDYEFVAIKFNFSVKVGNRYGQLASVGDGKNPWYCPLNSDTIIYNTYEYKNLDDAGNPVKLNGKELEITLNLGVSNYGGDCEFIIYNDILCYTYENSAYVSRYAGTQSFIGFTDFQILINGTTPKDVGIERIGKTGTEFLNSKTIEVNHNDKRTGGQLDRGIMSIDHATYGHVATESWHRISEGHATVYSIDDLLLQSILSNYSASFKKIIGTITAPGIHGTTNYLPFMVLQNSDYEGTAFFMCMGGDYDIFNCEFSGTFEQIKPLIETL